MTVINSNLNSNTNNHNNNNTTSTTTNHETKVWTDYARPEMALRPLGSGRA